MLRIGKVVAARRARVLLALGWYAGAIHHGVLRYAKQAGWIVNVDMLRSGVIPKTWRGDGIICILGMNGRLDRLVLRAKLPLVNIGPIIRPNIPSVMPDNDLIGRLAADHFLTRGFMHFAFYSRSGGPGEAMRLEAFRRHLSRPGTTFNVLSVPRADKRYARSIDARLDWLSRSLKSLPRPLAVMAEYDDMAVEVLQACDIGGLSVPEQVAVLGVDNDEFRCECAPVPLSSIDDEQAEQGYRAAALLDEMMKDGRRREGAILVRPRGIVIRKSTDILAIEHRHVAAALRTIWEHYTEPLTAGDVAQTVPMSARRLHDAFVRHVGRSMAEEIARRRVEHAQRLLRETRMKMAEVAMRSGFSSADHMGKVFARSTGLTPAAYRRGNAGADQPKRSGD